MTESPPLELREVDVRTDGWTGMSGCSYTFTHVPTGLAVNTGYLNWTRNDGELRKLSAYGKIRKACLAQLAEKVAFRLSLRREAQAALRWVSGSAQAHRGA